MAASAVIQHRSTGPTCTLSVEIEYITYVAPHDYAVASGVVFQFLPPCKTIVVGACLLMEPSNGACRMSSLANNDGRYSGPIPVSFTPRIDVSF